jgi:ferrochelatase
MKNYLLVNFGGPRSLEEIQPFLIALLTDRDVIRTRLPSWIQNRLFKRIAKKRSVKIQHDYKIIGGKSPIYFDTEDLGKLLSKHLQAPVFTFHRYLPQTHINCLEQLEKSNAEKIIVLPLFPQFCYATTGSIARFLSKNLSSQTLLKLRWIKSYAAHPAFINAFTKHISLFLKDQNLKEETVAFLFSAHGVPKTFITEGDIYQSECELSFQKIKQNFPKAISQLSYQSKFGPGEWIRPYTDEMCENVSQWSEKRENIVVIPLSFTSDHIETLFEIEHLYLPSLRVQGQKAFRCPAFHLEDHWVGALREILEETNFCTTDMLVRTRFRSPLLFK